MILSGVGHKGSQSIATIAVVPDEMSLSSIIGFPFCTRIPALYIIWSLFLTAWPSVPTAPCSLHHYCYDKEHVPRL